MLDYGFNIMNTIFYIDNESTICFVKNLVFHSKTKHIEIRYHFIRDSYEKKLIQVIKIHTDHNVIDLLTKAFDQRMGDALRINLQLKLTTAKVKKVNGQEKIQALVDKQKVIIIEESIRHDLKFNDAEGTACLPNDIIFEELARMSDGRPAAASRGGETGGRAGSGGGRTRGRSGNDRRGYTYKEFLACNPKEYNGRRCAIVYTHWISQRVKYTIGSFVEFFPCNEIEKLENKLWNHAIVGAGHAVYTDKFHELARLVPHLVTPEGKKIKSCVYGLAPQIQGMVAATEPKTIQKVVQLAGTLTDVVLRNESIKKNHEKRGNGREPSKDRNGREYNKRTRTRNAFDDRKPSRLVPHLVTPEGKKIESCVYGLAPQIQGMVAATEPKTIQQVVQLAGTLTDVALRNESIKKNHEKRGNGREPSKDRNGREYNKRTRT
nr:reverse transcriptase domain-containing protein [Tanacetum cinerariifolium]